MRRKNCVLIKKTVSVLKSNKFRALLLLVMLSVSVISRAHMPSSQSANIMSAEIRKDDNLVFSINTFQQNRERIDAILDTWASGTRIVISDCLDSEQHQAVTRLSEIPCAEYPPIRSWTENLKRLGRHDADWYFKVDDDTYVDVENLRLLITELERSGYTSDKIIFIGHFAFGRDYERASLGLGGSPYPLGGTGILMSNRTLQLLVTVVDVCMFEYSESMHSDTQLARCFYKIRPDYAAEEQLLITRFSKYFKPYYPAKAVVDVRPYSDSTVPERLDNGVRDKISLHSIKSPKLMQLVHSQIQRLRIMNQNRRSRE